MSKDEFDSVYNIYKATGVMTTEEIRKYLGLAPNVDTVTLSECLKPAGPYASRKIEKLRPEYMKELLRQIDMKIADLEDSNAQTEKTEETIYHLTTWYGLVYSAYNAKMNPPKFVWGDGRI